MTRSHDTPGDPIRAFVEDVVREHLPQWIAAHQLAAADALAAAVEAGLLDAEGGPIVEAAREQAA